MSSRLETDQTAALDGVNRVVMHALSALSPGRLGDPLKRKPLASYVELLTEAVIGPDPNDVNLAVREMRRARINSASIAEIYVPAVARMLGDRWVADTLDFGAVTIGGARLQSLLWHLEKDWATPQRTRRAAPPGYLVGVGQGNQHTLGAIILAGQLRHRGMSVNLDLELTPERLLKHVVNQQLSGILLSAAAGDDLAFLKELVDISHRKSRSTPVIIGGSILDLEEDIQPKTGADLVTASIHDVLWYCDARRVAQDDTFALDLDVK